MWLPTIQVNQVRLTVGEPEHDVLLVTVPPMNPSRPGEVAETSAETAAGALRLSKNLMARMAWGLFPGGKHRKPLVNPEHPMVFFCWEDNL